MFMVGMVVMKIKMAKKISGIQTSIDIFKVICYSVTIQNFAETSCFYT